MSENKTGDKLPRFIKLKDESGEETIHYNTVSKECPEEVKRYAEKELNETDENKRKGLEKLKAYIKRENLPELEDIYLIAVLRCCKYNIKKSEVKLKKFLNVRRTIIKNLKKLDNEKLEPLIVDGFSECLPWADKYGRPIYIFRPKMNLNIYDYQDMAVYAQACLFSVLTYPLPTTKGIAIIVDCDVKSPSVILQMMNEYRKYIGLEGAICYLSPTYNFSTVGRGHIVPITKTFQMRNILMVGTSFKDWQAALKLWLLNQQAGMCFDTFDHVSTSMPTKTVPFRIGRIDFVNENVIAHYAFALVRPFLPSKIVERIAFHGSDLTKLHKIYHPALLPDDFNGTLGPVDTNLFKEEKLRTISKLKAENIT